MWVVLKYTGCRENTANHKTIVGKRHIHTSAQGRATGGERAEEEKRHLGAAIGGRVYDERKVIR